MTPLQKAAQDIVERWDSPGWKDVMPTAGYIAELRKALEAEQAQAVEPVGYFYFVRNENVWKQAGDMQFKDAYTPLYLHQPKQRAPLDTDVIRKIMLSNGFSLKDGLADLKPYVYEAVRAIEAHHGITPADKPTDWSAA